MLSVTTNSSIDSFTSSFQGSSLLLARAGYHCQIGIVSENTGRVRGYVRQKGEASCQTVMVKGVPGHFPKDKIREAIWMLSGSYVLLRECHIEVRPRGCGGMMESSSSQSCFMWDDVPEHFLCPITQEVMKDPIVTSCGHTFEKNALLQYVEYGHNICPHCRSLFNPDPNSWSSDLNLKSTIDEWMQQQQMPPVLPQALLGDDSLSDNKKAEGLIDFAFFYSEKKEYARAIKQYEEALKHTNKTEHYVGYVDLLKEAKSPKADQALIYLARLYRQQRIKFAGEGQELKTEEAYRDAIQLMPKRIKYWDELAAYYHEIGAMEKEVQCYKQLIEITRENNFPVESIIVQYDKLVASEYNTEKHSQEYLTFLIENGLAEEARVLLLKIQCGHEQKYTNLDRNIEKEIRIHKERIAQKERQTKDLVKSVKKWIHYKRVQEKCVVSLDIRGYSYREVSNIVSDLERFSELKSLNLSGYGELNEENLNKIAKVKTLRKLDLSGCQSIQTSMIVHLLKKSPKIETLLLKGNGQLSGEGLQEIFKCGRNLQYIDFQGCDEVQKTAFDNLLGVTLLYRAKDSKLKIILPSGEKRIFSPSKCNFDLAIEAIAEERERETIRETVNLLNTNDSVEMELDLQSREIGDEGVLGLVKALERDQVITKLKLSLWHNKIKALGAQMLAKLLKTKPIVHTLNISFNPIGKEGIRALAKAGQKSDVLLQLKGCQVEEGKLSNEE